MNIFTNDDYRRIQAWLKANAIKDSDFAISEDTVPDEDILVITQNMSTVPTNYKIKIKDLLNSSLGKVAIDSITAKSVKVNNVLTVDAANVKLDNEKGTTLQDVLNYFEENKLNRHTDDTFDGNLTVKKNITIEGNIKSHDDTITVESDLEATGEITDGQGNMLSDVNDASKGWKIEYQDPQQDEPTVRAKYVLKDYRGVPKGNVIKIYKDSAITNVYLGTVEDTCNPNTGEVTKNPIHNNNEALSIVYRLDTGKYSLVNVPIKMFTTEAEFDKYRGLGVTSNGQVFIKLASDVESSNYLHFNELGEITANGIEARILRDLGNIITSVAGDSTMWGEYKANEGTKDSTDDNSRWAKFNKAEENRNKQVSDEIVKIQKKVDEVNLDTIKQAQDDVIQVIETREQEILTKTDASLVSSNTIGLEGNNVQDNLNNASNILSELKGKAYNLENVVSIIEQRVDILTKEQTIEHSAWDRNNNIVDVSIYEIFTYDVSQCEKLQISGKFQQNSPGYPFFVITDNNGEVIHHYGEDENATTLIDFEVTIPRSAKKLQINVRTYDSFRNSIKVKVLSKNVTPIMSAELKDQIELVKESNKALATAISKETSSESLVVPEIDTLHCWHPNDTYISISIFDCYWFPVDHSATYKVGFKMQLDSTSYPLVIYAKKTKSGTPVFVSKDDRWNTGMPAQTIVDADIDVPDDADYICLNVRALSSFRDAAYVKKHKETELLIFSKELEDRIEKLENRPSNLPLKGFDLYTIGDSLSAGGDWQKVVAELTGCTFDQSINANPSKPTSLGGTATGGQFMNCGVWRAKNLIDQNVIGNAGENAIIVIENVNDIVKDNQFPNYTDDEGHSSEERNPIILSTPIANIASLSSAELLKVAKNMRTINAVLLREESTSATILSVTSLPTKEGDIVLKMRNSTVAEDRVYTIHVVPQNTTEETMAYVIERIFEYDYGDDINKSKGEDGSSVAFASEYALSITFEDTGGTGMQTRTSQGSGISRKPVYYLGSSIEDDSWGNTANWDSYCDNAQGMECIIRMLKAKYPKARIFLAMFPYNKCNITDYYNTERKIFNDVAFFYSTPRVNARRYRKFLQNVGTFFDVSILDVDAEIGITPENYSTYYPVNNVHPLPAGYIRIGEIVSSMLKRYL